jgi:sugar/nucleoside kinase (ribokinase family)
VPVAAEAVVDTNGAGDAFLAGVVFGELHGLPVERSLALGAHVAALAVQSPELAPREPVDTAALLAVTAT